MSAGAFRRTIHALGAGGHYHYPKHVWSPAGGWWPSPANWKQNTAIAFGFVACSITCIATFSAANERRPMPPKTKIPSQSWCKYAAVDDPRLAK